MTELTCFLIGSIVAIVTLTSTFYHACKCDMIYHAFEAIPGIFNGQWQSAESIYHELGQRGVVFSASEFVWFMNKLTETHRIEADRTSSYDDTLSTTTRWYRLKMKGPASIPIYTHNTDTD
jgi:hypothetical protein